MGEKMGTGQINKGKADRIWGKRGRRDEGGEGEPAGRKLVKHATSREGGGRQIPYWLKTGRRREIMGGDASGKSVTGSTEPSITRPGRILPPEIRATKQIPVIASKGSGPKGEDAILRTKAEGRCKAGDPHVAIRIKRPPLI